MLSLVFVYNYFLRNEQRGAKTYRDVQRFPEAYKCPQVRGAVWRGSESCGEGWRCVQRPGDRRIRPLPAKIASEAQFYEPVLNLPQLINEVN